MRQRRFGPLAVLVLLLTCVGCISSPDAADGVATALATVGTLPLVAPSPAASLALSAPPHPSPLSPPAAKAGLQQSLAIRMLSPTAGWAERFRAPMLLAGGAAQLSVLRTADGGARWSEVTPSGIRGEQRAAAAFLDAERAWVTVLDLATNTIAVWRTGDGGATWQRAQFASPYPSLVAAAGTAAFIDPEHGWLLLRQHEIGMQCVPAVLYASADGGATWRLVSNTSAPDAGHLPFAGGLSFRSATVGWIAGNVACTGRGLLYATRDGGRTWQPRPLPLPPGQLGELSTEDPPMWLPPGAQFGYLTARFIPADRRQDEFAFVLEATTDGGRSWSARVLPEAGTVIFADAADGWLWVPPSFDGRGGGTLFVTHDGSQTWSPLPGGPADLLRASGGGGMAGLQFVSSTTGWATVVARDGGATTLLKTMNGGQT